MEIGSNLDCGYNESKWTHFVPVPSLTIGEAEVLKKQMQQMAVEGINNKETQL